MTKLLNIQKERDPKHSSAGANSHQNGKLTGHDSVFLKLCCMPGSREQFLYVEFSLFILTYDTLFLTYFHFLSSLGKRKD